MRKTGILILCSFVWNSLIPADSQIVCETIDDGYEFCKNSTTLTNVVETKSHSTKWSILHLYDQDISSIAPNAFKNLTVTKLVLEFPNKTLSLEPDSFNGLSIVDELTFVSGIVSLKENLFKKVASLTSLQLVIDGSKQTFKKALRELQNLRHLMIHDSHLSLIDAKTFVDFSAPISHLTVSSSCVTSIQSKAFSPLRNLRYLDFFNNGPMDLRPGCFDGLDLLQTLSLTGNDLTSISTGIFNGLKRLETLALINNNISDIEPDAFAGMNILELNLRGNRLSHLRHGMFNSLVRLKKLNLDNCQITKIGLEAFSGLNLFVLKLQENEFDVLETGAFQGLTSESLLFLTSNIHRVENGAFRNSTIKKIYLMNRDIAIDKTAWGLSNTTNVIQQ